MTTSSEAGSENAGRIDLGHGLAVSRLGFGGMALSHVYGGIDPADAIPPCTTRST